MDPRQFDSVAKLVGSGHSRRRVLKTLALASVGAALGLERAEAARRRSVGNSCTLNADCASGVCGQEARGRKICHCANPSDCPVSKDPCRPAACLPSGYCGTPITVGAPCADGRACTTGDVCQANGTCAGAPKSCDDANACTTDSCDPSTGNCVHTPISCDDGNQCATHSCDAQTGCVHTPIVCTALDPCHVAGTCDAATGACSHPTATDGTACTVSGGGAGACTAGTCVATCVTGTSCGAGGACLDGSCFLAAPCSGAAGLVANGGGVTACICGYGSNALCSTTSECPSGQVCVFIANLGSYCFTGCSA